MEPQTHTSDRACPVLSYQRAATPRDKVSGGWKVPPGIGWIARLAGTIGMIAGAVVAVMGLAVVDTDLSSGGVLTTLLMVEGICLFVGCVLGTIGRRSTPVGRQWASRGRFLVFATPPAQIAVAGVGGIFTGRSLQFITGCLVFFIAFGCYLLVVTICLVIVDLALGTD